MGRAGPFSIVLILGAASRSFAVQQGEASAAWPGWRGPTGLGYTEERNLPLAWDRKTGNNVLWKALLHGGRKESPGFSSPGWSSPVIWGNRILLTTLTWPAGMEQGERRASIARQHVLCYDLDDGKLLWSAPIPSGKILVNHSYHGYTVPTPVTDGTGEVLK